MLRLVINLDRCEERLRSMNTKLETFNLDFQRVSAVDGRCIDESTKAKLTEKKNFSKYILCRRELESSEIGCFLSHAKCWEKLLMSQEKYALIMEDDIQFSNRSYDYINNEKWIPGGGHIIQLSTLHPQPRKAIVNKICPLPNGDSLVHPITPITWGTQAYVISREAAGYALKISKSSIPAPVDAFLFHPLSTLSLRYPVYKLNPAIIIHDEINSFESTIFNKALMSYKSQTNSSLRRIFLKALAQKLKLCCSNDTLYYL